METTEIIARFRYRVKISEAISGCRSEFDDALTQAADMLEAHRWIPMSERLPEYGKWIVARRRGRRPFTCRYVHVPDRFGGYTEFRDADGVMRDPTEWFPLPEGPGHE